MHGHRRQHHQQHHRDFTRPGSSDTPTRTIVPRMATLPLPLRTAITSREPLLKDIARRLPLEEQNRQQLESSRNIARSPHTPIRHLPPMYNAPSTASTSIDTNAAAVAYPKVHTSPEDSNAVLDSGAMTTTAPRCLLMTSPKWESNIRPTRHSHTIWQHGNRAGRGSVAHRILTTTTE